MLDPQLRRAYTATHYRLPTLGTTVRIGQPEPPELACWRKGFVHFRWAILTAENPQSERCSTGFNRWAMRQLTHDLAAYAIPQIPTLHIDPSGRWPVERGVLAVVSTKLALRWARRYRQHAIVVGGLGERCRLIAL